MEDVAHVVERGAKGAEHLVKEGIEGAEHVVERGAKDVEEFFEGKSDKEDVVKAGNEFLKKLTGLSPEDQKYYADFMSMYMKDNLKL